MPPRRSFFVLFMMFATLGGCGTPDPAPGPTPEGQISPGRPDASGIPSAPYKGGPQ
jgi:hypothetical protein